MIYVFCVYELISYWVVDVYDIYYFLFVMCLIFYIIIEKNKEECCIICIFYIKGKLFIYIYIFIIYM